MTNVTIRLHSANNALLYLTLWLAKEACITVLWCTVKPLILAALNFGVFACWTTLNYHSSICDPLFSLICSGREIHKITRENFMLYSTRLQPWPAQSAPAPGLTGVGCLVDYYLIMFDVIIHKFQVWFAWNLAQMFSILPNFTTNF